MISTVQDTDTQPSHIIEEQLSKLGARLDHLIAKAAETKKQITDELQDLKDEGREALSEVKAGLDNAVADVNQAWKDVRIGTERAASKFHQVGNNLDSDEEYICLFCAQSFVAVAEQKPVCPKCGSKHENVNPVDEEDPEKEGFQAVDGQTQT